MQSGIKGISVALKTRLVDLVVGRLYPSIYLWNNPFKIHEYRELMDGVGFDADDIALDLGCGGGLHTFLLAEKCYKVIGLDISERWIGRARQELHRLKAGRQVEFHCAPIEGAGLAGNSINKIFSFSVLEHIVNYETALRECFRVLKPDGSMHFSVDWLGAVTDERLIQKHRSDHAIVRYFSPAEMKEILDRLGFRDIRIGVFVRHPKSISMFCRGIENGFRYSYKRSFFDSLCLARWERKMGQSKNPAATGIYLHVQAAKPR